MNKQEFGVLYYETVKKLENVLVNKANDYATQDVLSNFKRLSAAAKALELDVTTPLGYALFMCLMKLDRINNVTKNHKQVKNEGIEDSFVDLWGYAILGLGLFLEDEDVNEASS